MYARGIVSSGELYLRLMMKTMQRQTRQPRMLASMGRTRRGLAGALNTVTCSLGGQLRANNGRRMTWARWASVALCILVLSPGVALAKKRPHEASWKPLVDGLQQQVLGDGSIRAFRIDLQKMRLSARQSREGARVEEFVRGSAALIAVNGSFFDPDFRTLGLLLSDGERVSRLKKADWGVFSVTQSRGAIVHTRQWRKAREAKAEFAVQCGPRLVVNGRILNLKAQWARRTAIGVEADPRFVLLVLVDDAVLTTQLATLMRSLGARYALNLDGGSSTQLWTQDRSKRSFKGVPVANAILVSPR